MLRYWLGRGGVHQCMEPASFLLPHCGAEEPLRLREFMRQWTALMRASSRTVLRIARTKHLTQVQSNARVTKLVCSSSPAPRSADGLTSAAKRGAPRLDGLTVRCWDDDETSWFRFDERVCSVLEEAYQAGRPSVEFTLDPTPSALAAAAASGLPTPGPVNYRADLSKMTQKNLSTARERGIRCLLALLIKEKSGRVSQTVEINMPHDTLIRDLRSELPSYLRHDEKLLRMTSRSELRCSQSQAGEGRRPLYLHADVHSGAAGTGLNSDRGNERDRR
jgi:hypothetical protein